MAWNTDHPPINYLRRRIVYYKKKRGEARGWPKDEWFIQKHGVEAMRRASERRIAHLEKRIRQYEKAILKLQSCHKKKK